VVRLGSSRLRENIDDFRMQKPVLVGFIKLAVTTLILLNFLGGIWCGIRPRMKSHTRTSCLPAVCCTGHHVRNHACNGPPPISAV
jgi:hypothetical protein